MLSMLKEALEWRNRAGEAREVAGQLTDPEAVLELAQSFDRLAPSRCNPGCAPKKKVGEEGPRTKLVISPMRSLVEQQGASGGRKTMDQQRGILTPEERARVMQLQDLLIECFVEHREAVAEGQEERVRTVEAQIDSLLREKDEIEKWAAVGSA